MNKLTEQEELIVHANKKYRDGDPIMTDEQYDLIVDKLKLEHPESELLKRGVIEDSKKISRKESLPIPMFSLNKVKSVLELLQWIKKYNLENETFVLTSKYDGISLCVNEKENGVWTRGDGTVGQRSDFHFKKMGIEKNENSIFNFSFGEAIMTKEKFKKYSSEFANARNMVAGLFNRDVPEDSLRDVEYMRYGCDNLTLFDKVEQLIELNKINKISVPFVEIKANELTESLLDGMYNKWSKDFNIDGIVVDVNDAKIREELGREENNNPKYARAYKNPKWSGSVIVNVKGVKWQVSKQGKLKPIIQIEPIKHGGVTISNVTGNNAKYIFDNNIACNSIIEITRSGEVIPKHLKTVSFVVREVEKLADEVTECPICGEPTKWDETFTEIVCVNEKCEGRIISKMIHFFKTLEVEDFGEPSIRQLYKEGYNTTEKILNINKEELSNIQGWGETSASKLINQFYKLKNEGVSFAKLLAALDVFEGKIGEKVCQKIFDGMEDTDELFHKFVNLFVDYPSTESLLKIEGVAETTARIFQKGISYFDNFVETSVCINRIQTPKQETKGNKYEGWKICFTGVRPSKDQEKEIVANGGEIVSGVSKNTTHLCVKDLSEKTLNSSKAKKAKNLEIEIITFDNLINK